MYVGFSLGLEACNGSFFGLDIVVMQERRYLLVQLWLWQNLTSKRGNEILEMWMAMILDSITNPRYNLIKFNKIHGTISIKLFIDYYCQQSRRKYLFISRKL